MIKQTSFNQYLEQLFGQDFLQQARQIDKHMPNGLQLSGSKEIKKIVVGVSINQELIDLAIKKGADTIMVHHGLMLNFTYNLIPNYMAERLRLLLSNNINLYGFHYVLDAHQQLGNNAVLAERLGAKIIKPYFATWGFVAQLPRAVPLAELANNLQAVVNHPVLVVDAGKKSVQTLGVVSGRGVPYPSEPPEISGQIDVHITGEISEWVPHQFKEMGVSYLSAGHYATERLGVLALAKQIEQDLGKQLAIEFVDVENEI